MKLECMCATHVGRRSKNEDACNADPELGIFVVADGMGGYAGGEIASGLAITAIGEFFRRQARDADATWPFALDRRLGFAENLLRVAIKQAHQAIIERKRGPHAQMGATVASLLLRGSEAVIGHVGDSRVYRLRQGALCQLTRDHSLYAEMQAAGVADLPSREACSFTNVVTRALGMPTAEPEVRQEKVEPGDRYLLCSDGLFERLAEGDLARLLAAGPPASCCPRLVEAAYQAGGRDNITAVVVQVVAV